MLLLDLEQGRIVDDEELKRELASAKPYRQWIETSRVSLEDLPEPAPTTNRPFRCWTVNKPLIYAGRPQSHPAPMVTNGEEPTGSMGNDAALPVLSNKAAFVFTTISVSCSPG